MRICQSRGRKEIFFVSKDINKVLSLESRSPPSRGLATWFLTCSLAAEEGSLILAVARPPLRVVLEHGPTEVVGRVLRVPGLPIGPRGVQGGAAVGPRVAGHGLALVRCVRVEYPYPEVVSSGGDISWWC